MRVKTLLVYCGFFFLVLSLFSPRYEFFHISSALNSGFRLDTLAQLGVSIGGLLSPIFYFLIILEIVVSGIHLLSGNSVVRTLGSCLLMFSFLGAFVVGRSLNKKMACWFFVGFIICNCISMIIGSIFNIFSLKYGVFNLPFGFAISMLGIWCSLLYVWRKERGYISSGIFWAISLIMFFGLVLGENRAGLFVCLLVFGFSALQGRRGFKLLFGSFLVVVALSLLVWLIPGMSGLGTGRVALFMEELIAADLRTLFLSDASIMTRIANGFEMVEFYQNLGVVEQVAAFVFGRGGFSFLDYSVQYGGPGHHDVLWLRVFAENGILGLVFWFIILFMVSKKSVPLVLVILFLGLVGEGAYAVKSSLIIWMSMGFVTREAKGD